MSVQSRRALVAPSDSSLSIERQCELLGLARSSYYYVTRPVDAPTLDLMSAIDRIHLEQPTVGSPKMCAILRREGWTVNHKRVERLMRVMDIQAIYQRPRTSQPDHGHRIYPYRLRGLRIERPNQVWATDITFVRVDGGWMYLMAVIDWFSRYVIAWDLSNTIDATFCCSVLERALSGSRPEIFNTDQGATFTSAAFTGMLESRAIAISMDGRGRALDNVIIERLWRTVKYEYLYLHAFESVFALLRGLETWFPFYNEHRLHQGLEYATPIERYRLV
jgi:putative transposase